MESNDYLKQVLQEQAQVEGELRQRNKAPLAAPQAAGAMPRSLGKGLIEFKAGIKGLEDEEEGAPYGRGGAAVDYRITGFWRWKTVVVPPNVYVVHTRRGHAEPLHVGLGVSFRYDPATDAFLVIPAAVQTLLINARCICAERQGILVQGYVQWIVDDVQTAYRKLDFSDPTDPMRIVNVQLREQAEAAIKDKVATMGIDAVLADKQPIIEELTTRLRAVAEGSRDGERSSGLGLKIVTVQIKEAVVSSRALWENLQKPFRAERARLARMAELEAEEQIARRELVNRHERETTELETAQALALLRARQEREAYDREQAEKERRHQVEQSAQKARAAADEELALQEHELAARAAGRELEATRRQVELETARAELAKAQAAATVERDNLVHAGESARKERDLALYGQQRAVENDLSEQHVKAQLVARLPEIAAALPKPEELRSISVNGDGAAALTGMLAGLMQAVEGALKGKATTNGK